MKILYKIMLFGISIVLMLLVVGLTGLIQLESLNKGVERSNIIADKMINENIPLMKDTINLEQSFFDIKIKIRNVMISNSKNKIENLEKEINKNYEKNMAVIEKLKEIKEIKEIEKSSGKSEELVKDILKNKKTILRDQVKNENGINALLEDAKNLEKNIFELEKKYKEKKDKEIYKKLKKTIRLTEFQLKRKKKIVNNKSLNDKSVADSLGMTLAISGFFYPGGVGKQGYVFVIDKNKNVLKHPYMKEINFKDKLDKKAGSFILKDYLDENENKREVYIYYKATKYRGLILMAVIYTDNIYNLTNYKVLNNNYLELTALTKDSLVVKGKKYKEVIKERYKIIDKLISNIDEQKKEKINQYNLKNYNDLEESLKNYNDIFDEVNSVQEEINLNLGKLNKTSIKIDRILAEILEKIDFIRARSEEELKIDSDKSQKFIRKVQKQSGIGANIVKVFIGLGVLISLVLTVILTILITKPIKYLEMLMNKASEGDLRVFAEVKTKDELKSLGDSFNKMIEGMKDLIEGSTVLAKNVEEESMLLSSSVTENRATSNSIVENIDLIKNHAEDNVSKLNSFNDELQAANDNMNKIKSEALNSSKASKESKEISIKGKELSKKIKEESELVAQNSDEIKGLILKLNSEIGNISEFLLKINSISEQTDMLALNAAIEAARAGEFGKGFAVVSQEIRILSSQTSDIAKKISEFVQDIEYNSTKIVGKVSSSETIIEGVKEKMDSMINNLNMIVEQSIETNVKMENISDMSIEQFDSFENIQRDTSEISQETKKTLEEIKTVNIAMEEQNKTSEYISEASESLNTKIESLNELIKRFKL